MREEETEVVAVEREWWVLNFKTPLLVVSEQEEEEEEVDPSLSIISPIFFTLSCTQETQNKLETRDKKTDKQSVKLEPLFWSPWGPRSSKFDCSWNPSSDLEREKQQKRTFLPTCECVTRLTTRDCNWIGPCFVIWKGIHYSES